MIPLLALASVLAMAPAAQPHNLCTLCHPGVRVEFAMGIHSTEEVVCTSCHGGDATASTVAGAHRGDFKGPIRRQDIPKLCSTCHSNTEMMRPYNLPTDQYALYLTSRHGKALARGDTKVAVCTDCHGTHKILPPEDPSSTVHPSNVARTCAGCHSDTGLMSQYGLEGDPYVEFTESVHGAALAARGHVQAPTCARCHGAHGATPPGVGDVDKVCGQCHATARAHYLEGPHKAAMAEAGLPECASCHGYHDIRKTGIDMLDTVCLDCHDGDSAQVELSQQMKTLYTTALADTESAHALVNRAAKIPLYVEDYRSRLEEARTSLIESLVVMHSLDLSGVEALTLRARSIGHEVESELGGKLEGRKWRRVGLLVFWFYLIVTVGLLVRFRRKAAQENP